MKFFVSFQRESASLFPQKWWASGGETLPWQLPLWSIQSGIQAFFLWYKRETGLKDICWAPTSFPELAHENFGIIGGKIFGLCLFRTVV